MGGRVTRFDFEVSWKGVSDTTLGAGVCNETPTRCYERRGVCLFCWLSINIRPNKIGADKSVKGVREAPARLLQSDLRKFIFSVDGFSHKLRQG